MSNRTQNGESIIIAQLNKFTRAIYSAFGKGLIGRVMTSYTRLDDAFGKSTFSEKIVGSNEYVAYPSKKDGGVLASVVSAAKCRLLSTDFSTYTVFSVFYLISVLIASILKMYNNGDLVILEALKITAVISVLILSVVFCSFLATDKSLGRLLLESKIVQLILNKLLGIGEEYYYYYENRVEKHIPTAIIIGVLLGALAYFFSPLYLAMGLVILLLCAIVFSLPEVGIVLMILFMPLLSNLSNNGIAPFVPLMLIEISYAHKVKNRKRHFSFHIADLFIVMLAFAFLFGGFTSNVSSKVSLVEAIKAFVLALAYLPIRNMMSDKLWIKKFINALFVSGLFIAIACLVQMIVGAISPAVASQLFGVEFSGYANVLFSGNTTLGIYVAVTAVISLTSHENNGNQKSILFFGCIVLMCVSILCTLSIVAITALAIGITFFLTINSHKTLTALLLSLVPITLAVTLAASVIWNNGEAMELMSERSEASLMFRLNTWNDSLMILKDNWFAGIGMGAFTTVFDETSVHLSHNVTNTGSLYLDVWVSLGVVGFVLFLAVIFIHLQRAFTFLKKSKNSASARKLKGALCMLVMLALLGFVKSFGDSVALEFLLWLALALVNAISDYGYNELRLQDSQNHATPYETVIRFYIDQ